MGQRTIGRRRVLVVLLGAATACFGATGPSGEPPDAAHEASAEAAHEASAEAGPTDPPFDAGVDAVRTDAGCMNEAGTPPMESPILPAGLSMLPCPIGLAGAWYAYGDDWGPTAMPPGVCETVGMHPSSACSLITFPMPDWVTTDDAGDAVVNGVFPPGGSPGAPPGAPEEAMCLSGSAAQVLPCVAGVAGCSGADVANMTGIGIALDFNHTGTNGRQAYDAPANGVLGFAFTLSGVPEGGVRVEFPTTDTAAAGSAPYALFAPADGAYLADLTTSPADCHALSVPVSSSDLAPPAFDASHVLSIAFHVPATTAGAVPVSAMCVSSLAAIVTP